MPYGMSDYQYRQEIVRQVKALKAEEIKKLLADIDGVVMEEAGPIDPAPEPVAHK